MRTRNTYLIGETYFNRSVQEGMVGVAGPTLMIACLSLECEGPLECSPVTALSFLQDDFLIRS